MPFLLSQIHLFVEVSVLNLSDHLCIGTLTPTHLSPSRQRANNFGNFNLLRFPRLEKFRFLVNPLHSRLPLLLAHPHPIHLLPVHSSQSSPETHPKPSPTTFALDFTSSLFAIYQLASLPSSYFISYVDHRSNEYLDQSLSPSPTQETS